MIFTRFKAFQFVTPLGDIRDRGIRYQISYGSVQPPYQVDEADIPKWSRSYMTTKQDKLHPTDLTVRVSPYEWEDGGIEEVFTLTHDQIFDPDNYELSRYSYDHVTAGKVIQALLDGAYRMVEVDDVGHLQADGLPDLAYQGSWAGYDTFHALKVWPWQQEEVFDPESRQSKYRYDFSIIIQCTIAGRVVDDSDHDTATEIAHLHELYDHELPERMSAAEFTALREALHLPVAWLADRWGVRRQSVLRWQSGEHRIPDYIAIDMNKLAMNTQDVILDLRSKKLNLIEIPRGDGRAEDGMPKAWHRMVGRQVARSACPRARLAYLGENAVL